MGDRVRDPTAYPEPTSCRPSSSPGPAGSSAGTSCRALLDAGHRVVALVRGETAGEPVLAAAPGLRTAAVSSCEPATSPIRPASARRSRGGRRRPPGGDPAGLRRRLDAPADQHGRDPGRARGDGAGGRRPAHPHGRPRRRGRSEAALRELEGQGGGAGGRVDARVDDRQALAPVRAGRRVLQHDRRAGPPVPGRDPGAGRRLQPVPADPCRRRRAGRRRVAGDPSTVGGIFDSAGRATGPTARSPARSCSRSASAGPSCRCRCR